VAFFISGKEKMTISQRSLWINPKKAQSEKRFGGVEVKNYAKSFSSRNIKNGMSLIPRLSASKGFDFGIETLGRSVCRRIIQYLRNHVALSSAVLWTARTAVCGVGLSPHRLLQVIRIVLYAGLIPNRFSD